MQKELILIVDDMEINRDILEDILGEQYTILQAADGGEAIKMIEQYKTSLAAILLDLVMPVVDGFGVLEYMGKQEYLDKIPVLVISGEDSVQTEERCFDMGTSDFIRKPFDNSLVKKRVSNIVELYSYKKGLEDKIRQQTETLRNQYNLLHKQAKELEKKNENIIDILGTVVEHRDLESGEHICRVKGYTKILADELMKDYPEYGLTEKKVAVIVSASAMHDIGKIAIPDHILLKPGRLTPEEYEYMKSHTLRGCEILSNIRGAWDEEYGKCCYEICRYHHERYDGKGYPDGLVGEEIPISAQLVSVADAYEALVHERVYKDAYPKDKAFQMILQGECGVFSPKLLEVFRKVRKEFESLTDQEAIEE
jgi:putative two-component system response regulator